MCIYIYEDPRYLTAYYISISSGSQEAAALAPARSTYPTYPLLRQRCRDWIRKWNYAAWYSWLERKRDSVGERFSQNRNSLLELLRTMFETK